MVVLYGTTAPKNNLNPLNNQAIKKNTRKSSAATKVITHQPKLYFGRIFNSITGVTTTN